MMFFALLGGIALAAWGLSRIGVPGLRTWPARMRPALAIALLLAGIDHLVSPGRYLPMIEAFMPWPATVVAATGLCEIAGAIGLLLPATRRAAAILLAVYFVCVFPANIANAVNGLAVDGLPQAAWYYWLRLGFQPLVIWWALRAGGVVGPWPFAPAAESQRG